MMTLSIMGMHYTALISTNITDKFVSQYQAEHDLLLFTIILVTCLVLVASFIVAVLEQRLNQRNLELRKANKELANLSIQDNLTKLPNRLYLVDYAEVLLSDHRYKDQKIAFLYIDLDRFKSVNDAFGHHIGDQLLIQMANRLHWQLNEKCKLLRIGGDEFLLIAENTDTEEAMQLAEKVLHLIQDSYQISGKEINISASLGIALFPEHGQNVQDLLMNADAAMLMSKEQGRNTYTVFSYSTHQQETQTLISELLEKYEITGLVNAAGVLIMRSMLEAKTEDWETLFAVNVMAPIAISQQVAKHFCAKRRGSIVTISSNSARMPRMQLGMYATTKAALSHFCRNLALEIAPYQVRLNIVSPGSTLTQMQQQLWTDNAPPPAVIDGDLSQYRTGIPLRKLAQPDDIANTVSFLLSDRAAQITMQEIVVDGGATLGV
ncbi:SDR family oxidoreductase [Acinetobacter baumannii]